MNCTINILYEHVLSETKTARIFKMVRILFLFLTRFHVNVARSNGNPTWRVSKVWRHVVICHRGNILKTFLMKWGSPLLRQKPSFAAEL